MIIAHLTNDCDTRPVSTRRGLRRVPQEPLPLSEDEGAEETQVEHLGDGQAGWMPQGAARTLARDRRRKRTRDEEGAGVLERVGHSAYDEALEGHRHSASGGTAAM